MVVSQGTRSKGSDMADSKHREPSVVRPVECKYCKETARYAGWTNGGVEFV